MLRHAASRLHDLRILRDRTDGAVAIEYAVLAVIVGLGIVSGLVGLKNRINSDVDAISYNIANSVVAPTQSNRTVTGTTKNNLVVNGITYAQTRTSYSDGSAEMVQIPSDPIAATYAKGVYVYDTNGSLTSMTFTRGDGSLVNSVAYSTIRPGVSVSTLTDQTGVPYTYQTYASVNGAVETDSQYMIDNGGRTDIWTQRIQTYDNTNPNATTYSAVCTYQGGRTAAC